MRRDAVELLATPSAIAAAARTAGRRSDRARSTSGSSIPARDGYVSITFLFGSAIGPFTRPLMDCVHERGLLRRGDARQGLGRATLELLATGSEPSSEFERVKRCVADFTSHADEGRAARGGARARSADRAGRDDRATSWRARSSRPAATGRTLEQPSAAGRCRFPGRSPASRDRAAPIARPPRRGRRAHRDRSCAELRPRRRPHASRTPGDGRSPAVCSAAAARRASRSLDFMWVDRRARRRPGSSPTTARPSCGSSRRRRSTPAGRSAPFLGRPPGPDERRLFHNIERRQAQAWPSTSSKPGGPRRSSSTSCAGPTSSPSRSRPKAMRRWGLDYESLREVQPDLVMLSSCLMGQTGPLRDLRRLRQHGRGHLRLLRHHRLARPRRRRARSAPTPTTSRPASARCAILAALEHRRRTGEGQYIDLSQAEASLHFLAPGAARLRRERPRPDADRATRPRSRAARRLPGGGRRPLDRDRRRERRVLALLCATSSAVPSSHRPALRDAGRTARRCDELDAARRRLDARHDMHVAERILQEPASRRTPSRTPPSSRSTRSSSIAATSASCRTPRRNGR